MSFYKTAYVFERAAVERAFKSRLMRKRVDRLCAARFDKVQVPAERVRIVFVRKLAELQCQARGQAVVYIIERRFVNVLLVLPSAADVDKRYI